MALQLKMCVRIFWSPLGRVSLDATLNIDCNCECKWECLVVQNIWIPDELNMKEKRKCNRRRFAGRTLRSVRCWSPFSLGRKLPEIPPAAITRHRDAVFVAAPQFLRVGYPYRLNSLHPCRSDALLVHLWRCYCAHCLPLLTPFIAHFYFVYQELNQISLKSYILTKYLARVRVNKLNVKSWTPRLESTPSRWRWWWQRRVKQQHGKAAHGQTADRHAYVR